MFWRTWINECCSCFWGRRVVATGSHSPHHMPGGPPTKQPNPSKASVVITRNSKCSVDLLVLHSRLQHHPFRQLIHDATLNLLPRCLTRRIWIPAFCLQLGASLRKFLLRHQHVRR